MNPEQINIVLAEDDRDDRLMFKDAFKTLKLPHSLTVCEDGEQLLEYLDYTAEEPHIIFLDINMPKVNGVECLRKIRENERLNDTSVAMYTGRSADTILKDLYSMGANIFIEKPNSFGHLEKILKQIISINWQYIIDGLDREKFIMKY